MGCPGQHGSLHRKHPPCSQAPRQRFRRIEPATNSPTPMRRHRNQNRAWRRGRPSCSHPTSKSLPRVGPPTVFHAMQDLGGSPFGTQAKSQRMRSGPSSKLPQRQAAGARRQPRPRETAPWTCPCHFIRQQEPTALQAPSQTQKCPPHEPKDDLTLPAAPL